MERAATLQELIEAADAGAPVDPAALPPSVERSWIESLKRDIDVSMRTDAQRSLRLAELAERLAAKLDDPLATAVALRGKAQALHVLGRYSDALECYRKAASIQQAHQLDLDRARTERAMIDALMYLGRYDEALDLAESARRVFQSHGDALALAHLENNVGNIYHRLDQNAQSLSCYEIARRTFQEAGDGLALAVTSFNQANVFSNINEFRRAEELYESARDAYRERGMDLAAAQATYSLGYLQFLKGHYHQAIHTMHVVREDFVRLGDVRAAALCGLDLAEIYLQVDVLDEAADHANRVALDFQRLGMRYESAKAQAQLGLACLKQGRLELADEALTAALADFRLEGNEVQAALISLYRSELSLRQHRIDRALALAREAATEFERHKLPAKRNCARLVEARALALLGDASAAMECVRNVIQWDRCSELPGLEYQARELLGDLLSAQHAAEGALEEYRLAIGCIERMRSGIRVDEFRTAFFRDKLRVYEKAIPLCLRRAESSGLEDAFFFLESQKARTLVDFLTDDLQILPEDNAQLQDLHQRWRKLREELQWFHNKANDHDVQGRIRSMATDTVYREEMRSREQALEELTCEAQIRDARFSAVGSSPGLTLLDLQAALAVDETIAEYYIDGNSILCFVIDRDRRAVVECPTPIAEVRELILELKFQLDKFQYGAEYVSAHMDSLRDCTDRVLERLYQALYAPIAPLVRTDAVVFVPFGPLHNVPFHALFDGRRYLLDRLQVSYAPSAKLHVLCQMKSSRPVKRLSVIGVADSRAPRIAEEVGSIVELFPDARCLVGDLATREAVEEQLRRSDIVHIACHAVFRQDNPMFSALRLSGGLLNAYDVSLLRTPPSLVTLSGCSTGVGRVFDGDEMMGLVRGFLHAGAASLVVSLWTVNDPATAALMAEFYRKIANSGSLRSALREALLELKAKSQHPYYWAPFILIGRA